MNPDSKLRLYCDRGAAKTFEKCKEVFIHASSWVDSELISHLDGHYVIS